MATNLQTFAGEVEIPDGNLQLKRVLELSANTSNSSNTGILISRTLGASSDSNVIVYFDEDQPALRIGHTVNAASDNVILMDTGNNFTMNIFGDVEASFFKGDGGLLSNLVTDFQSVSEFGASTDQQVTLSNLVTGLNVSVGNVVVAGNVTATTFIGDGSQLDNIASSLEEIVINGNVTSNIMELRNATSLVTTGKVGVGNLFPEHTLSVGSNLWVDDARTDGNTLSVQGNAYISHKLTLGSIEILPGYDLQQTSNLGNTTTNTLEFNNATTAFVTSKMAGIGIEPSSADVGVAGLHVDGHLRLGGPANTDENSDIYLRTAGALNLNANDTDTDNQYTGLVMRAGNSNESNITIEGALSDSTKQYITFATRNTERMRIDEYGNVSIGTSDDSNYMLNVAGEANCVKLTTTSLQINTIPLSIIYQLDDILENGNVTTNVATFGKVSVSDPTVATTASNIVTWNATTQEFEDSGGLISNKLSIVSEQPPSALSANATTVANHGTYTLTTSGLATNSNTWNAFDDDSANAWVSVDIYKGASNVYDGTVQLAPTTGLGEWLAVELPYKATLRYVKLTPSSVASYPTDANLYATNDSVTWELLKEWTGVTPGSDTEEQTVFVNASDAYKKYAIVPTKVAGDSITVAIQEWKMFCESFTVDGGKVKMATTAVTGGETVVDQTSAHPRESAVLKKYPEVRFDGRKLQYNAQSNTYTLGGYTVSGSSSQDTHTQYRAFDGDASTFAHAGTGDSFGGNSYAYDGTNSLGGISGYWHKLQLPYKIKLNQVKLRARSGYENQAPKDFTFIGSNDNTIWTTIQAFTGQSPQDDGWSYYNITSNPIAYKYLAIVTTRTVGDAGTCSFAELEYYGYEETNTTGDTSLDTTITSKYNTPDLTNASLYLDGLKGSTATDYSGNELTVTENNVTWDSTEKAWVLSGAATSNIVTGDLGFEGDQPHSVSAWVKADVLNGDGLFHLGTNESVGDAASRVGFVDDSHISWGGEDHYFSNAEWHNVTYTYNSKSSEKALYIDGQKVGSGGNEDTFGEYPPFAMMTYSEHGYTVSASSTYTGNSNWSPFEAFNKQVGGTIGHITEDNHYTTADPGTYNGTAANAFLGIRADTGADIVEGDWLKIEMPHKLIASYLRIYSSSDEPDSFKLYGSNDDSVWTELLSVTGNTTINAYLDYPTSTRGAFKYFALVVSKQGSTYTYWRLDEMKIYGHRENDLVRFPEPTKVLSYPHIDMMGRNAPLQNTSDLTHAQRGYVVSASSMYVSNARNPYEPWRAFSYYSGYWWASTGLANTYGGGSGAYGTVRSANLGTDSGGSATPENGEWIKIEMPRKITLSSLMIRATSTATAAPKDFKLYGSNDGTSWTEILSETGAVPGTTGTHYTPSSTPSAYKHFGLVVTRSGGRTDYIEIGKLEFYGTEESLDVIARIGDGFEGKVRNFRVYSTALSGDRIKSIFDAEKDEFQLASSSVSVYRGNLGIGTTTPSAALTVMDNVKEMDEFPPSAMTEYETHIEGHGVFEAYGSSDFGATFYRAFNAFNKSVSTVGGNDGWASREYTWVAENALPETSNCAVFDGVYCEWIALRMPYKVKLKKVSLQARNDGSVPHEMPKRGRIYGSNDRTLWTKIHDYSNLPAFTEGSTYYLDVNTSEYYKHILLTADERYSASSGSPRWVAIGEIRYFGTREHGASTLDNGELKLTRNLTVPRIGPALNEYDVPQRHRLHIEYDTSLPIHADLPIDTSGNSRDGAYGGSGVYYSYPEKAFHYDGTNQLTGTTAFVEGDNTFTFSMWVKMTKKDSTDCFIYFGDSAVGAGIGVDIYSNGQFYWYTYGGNYLLWYGVAGDWFPLNTWTHLAITHYVTRAYDGLGFNDRNRVYINGVYQTPEFVRDDGNTYDPYFDVNDTFCIGGRNNSYHLNGAISNFQLWWDVVLSPEEIWQTYKRGRVPEKHHLQIADSTVTIGGHNRDRNVQLDVAGHIKAGSQEIHTFTGQHRCFPSEPVEQGLIVSADKNQFVKMNKGLATGSKAITIDESLPVVSLSNVAQDKRCFGVVSSLEKSNTVTRREVTNGIVSEQKKELGDNRAIVNSVGEGAIWVCDAGGPLDSGDYITTSNVPGYGMAQSDDLLHNYTVAKITMDCDFTASNVAVRTIKKEMTGLRTITEDAWNTLVEYDRDSNSVTQYSNTLSVEAWSNLAAEDASGYDPTTVTTTVDYTDGRSNLISIEEWSNLAPGEQILYSANTHTEIVDYTKFIDVGEWSNLEASVQNTFSEAEVVTYYRKEWGQNVLDDRGNLIWEEKTGEWEAPYKLRFLDATGAQTDEANCVYRAAFVGCTYHCG